MHRDNSTTLPISYHRVPCTQRGICLYSIIIIVFVQLFSIIIMSLNSHQFGHIQGML